MLKYSGKPFLWQKHLFPPPPPHFALITCHPIALFFFHSLYLYLPVLTFSTWTYTLLRHFWTIYSVPVTYMTFMLPQWNEIWLFMRISSNRLACFGRAKCPCAACTRLFGFINSNTRRFAPPPIPVHPFADLSLSIVHTVIASRRD